MKQQIVQISVIVRDYDEAIAFYTEVMKFDLIEDTKRSEDKRWVVVAPPDGNGCTVLLAKAKNEEQLSRVGNQTGNRVFVFLHTDDFWRDYQHLSKHDVKFKGEPREEEYGTVVVFADLYGNLWDLIEPK
ncbi:MAG: VOC family protein [Crocinitomicaceae bacterium]|nr:VOC family protein [Crocinitomicaceae bacterium]